MQEIENSLRILKETLKAFKKSEENNLKSLSNQTIHTAATSQDFDNIILAVIVYALGKILERDNYKQMDGWDLFFQTTIKNIDKAIASIKNKDFESFRLFLGKIREDVNKIDSNLSSYVKDVFYKAQINKASKIYQHGVSAQKAAELLGVSLWDLASYIGQGSVNEADIKDSLLFSERKKIMEEFLK
ncbi:MAG: hypothetical protein QXX68_03015 [Candidatus Pacearchaeota archaeon]